LDVKEGDKVQAGQTLMVLNMPDLEYAVLQAEDAARAAEFEYQYWIPARFDRPPERRQLAEQELVKVQRSLDSARAELTQATLTAPFDGTIVSLDTAPGELVQPNQVVITLANLGHLKIETTDLSERDLPDVQIGQPAVVFVEALGEEFSGGQPANLRWGMSAEVNISTQ
jgi:multidrug resistance efflux pump